jgi:hypothetical protein
LFRRVHAARWLLSLIARGVEMRELAIEHKQLSAGVANDVMMDIGLGPAPLHAAAPHGSGDREADRRAGKRRQCVLKLSAGLSKRGNRSAEPPRPRRHIGFKILIDPITSIPK